MKRLLSVMQQLQYLFRYRMIRSIGDINKSIANKDQNLFDREQRIKRILRDEINRTK